MESYHKVIREISAGKFAPVYLLFGEEKYLQEELIKELSRSFLDKDVDFGREKLDGASLTLEEILSRLNESALFAKRRLLIVDSPVYLVAPLKNEHDSQPASTPEKELRQKDDADLMSDYLDRENSNPPESILIFTAPRVDRRKRFYKIIDQKAVSVECSPLKGDALAGWIRSKANQLNKQIDRGALEQLLLAGEQNLHYLSGELEKYCAYLGDEQNVITAQTVDLLFTGDIQGDVFKLADAIAEGNPGRAYTMMTLLLRRREKPLQIFFMLVRHFRLLLQAHCLLEEGMPPAEFTSALGVHPFAARKLKDQAGRYSRNVLEEVLVMLQKTDLEIKTGRLEQTQALELVLSRIEYIQGAAPLKI